MNSNQNYSIVQEARALMQQACEVLENNSARPQAAARSGESITSGATTAPSIDRPRSALLQEHRRLFNRQMNTVIENRTAIGIPSSIPESDVQQDAYEVIGSRSYDDAEAAQESVYDDQRAAAPVSSVSPGQGVGQPQYSNTLELSQITIQQAEDDYQSQDVGCGSLVDNYLIDNSSISFSATSGDPGRPLISGKPWKPTNVTFQNSLTVDLGANYSVSQVLWSGDPTASEQTNIIEIQYSYDSVTWDCRRKALAPSVCNPYFGNFRPPVPPEKINVVNLGNVVTARYFRFVPLEPGPGVRPGSDNLRIDVNGCIKGIFDIDLVFLLSSTSTVTADANAAFAFMKNTAKEFVTQYGMTYVRYGLIVFGSTVNDVFNLNFTAHTNKAGLKSAIDAAVIISGSADLKTALGNAKTMLQGPGSRAHARKIAVVMMDKDSSQSQNELELAAKSLRDTEGLVIGIGIGRQIPVNQLEWITLNSYYIMLFPWTGNYRHLCFGLAARCFKEFDITFAVGAASANSAAFFRLMKDTMGEIALKYGIRTIHYSFVTYGLGSGSASVVYSFTATGSLSSSNLKTVIDGLTQPSGSGTIATDAALNRCQSSFNDARVRGSAEKVVVLMTDKSSSISTATLRSLSYALGTSGLRIIPVAIGTDMDRRELLAISSNSEDVIHVTNSETASALELKVMHNVYRLYMFDYDMTFIMYAFSSQSSSYFTYMQSIIRIIIQRYGYGRCRYTFIVYGGSSIMYYRFDSKAFPNLESLLRAFARIPRAIGGFSTNLTQAFEHARVNFQSDSRSDAWKVLVVMMDKNTGMNEATLRSMTTSLEELGVFIIPVGMGREINIVEYYYFTAYRDFVTFSSDYTSISYLTIGENIMRHLVRFEYVDMMFVINADSVNFAVTYALMKNCTLRMIRRFGVYRFRYSIIIYGSSFTKHVDFSTTFPYKDALVNIVNGLTRQSGFSGIIAAIGEANTIFTALDFRSIRGLAIIMDKSSGQSVVNLQNAAKPLHENGVTIVASGIDGSPPFSELRVLTISNDYVIQVSSNYSAALLGVNIMAKIIRDGVKQIDFVFAISLSGNTQKTMTLAKNTIRQIVMRYGIHRFHYCVIVYGRSGVTTAFDFGSILPDKQSILDAINNIKRYDQATEANEKLAFVQARTIFTTKPSRKEARKVLVVITDKPSSNSLSELEAARMSLYNMNVTVIAVGLGLRVTLKGLFGYTAISKHIIHVPSDGVSYLLAQEIIHLITRVAVPCKVNLCKNGGTCFELNTCICKKGFSGFFCETRIVTVPCKVNLCKNGGTRFGVNTCICKKGFSGFFCETAIEYDQVSSESISDNSVVIGLAVVVGLLVLVVAVLVAYICLEKHKSVQNLGREQDIRNNNVHANVMADSISSFSQEGLSQNTVVENRTANGIPSSESDVQQDAYEVIRSRTYDDAEAAQESVYDDQRDAAPVSSVSPGQGVGQPQYANNLELSQITIQQAEDDYQSQDGRAFNEHVYQDILESNPSSRYQTLTLHSGERSDDAASEYISMEEVS